MTYKEASAYIADAARYKISLGLSSERRILEEMGDPQKELNCIHIAGTNGKGSVLAYLAGILREAGYTVGCYISPSVVTYREKIQVNGEMISEEDFADVMTRVRDAAERMVLAGEKHPTQFELETAAAFLYFYEKKCDYCILETGMGGRLDATNVLDFVSVGILTSISMDHMNFLGDTIEAIAGEKAGIIKPGMDVIYLKQRPEVNEVIENAATENGAVTYPVSPDEIQILEDSFRGQRFSYDTFDNLSIRMAGVVQPLNASLAICAAKALNRRGAEITDEAISDGIRKVLWPGRFGVLSEEPILIADGAHNPDAALYLAESLEHYFPGKCLTGIMGVFKDKDYEKIIDILGPLFERVITVAPPDANRALSAAELKSCMERHGIISECADNLPDAVEKARSYSGSDGIIVAFGTLSYMGELLRIIEHEKKGSRDERKIDSCE